MFALPLFNSPFYRPFFSSIPTASPALNVPLKDVKVPISKTAIWPSIPSIIVNDFLLTAVVEIPPAPATGQTKVAVFYKWQNSNRFISFQLQDTGKLRINFKDVTGTTLSITMDATPAVGDYVQIKFRKSATYGAHAWFNNVKDSQGDAARTQDLDSVLLFNISIGDNSGASAWGAKMNCVSLYQGDFSDAKVAAVSLCTNVIAFPYLNDADSVNPPAPIAGMTDISGHKHPKKIFIEGGMSNAAADVFRKYDIVNSNATTFGDLRAIQTAGHQFIGRGLSPFQTMEKVQNDNFSCSQGWNIPFTGTTPNAGDLVDSTNYGTAPATTDCKGGVPASWWLYRAGSATTGAINSTDTTVNVADGTKYELNKYAAIYDAAGDFTNAEHVYVTNIVGNVVTIQRGFYSNPVAHASGSYMAQHQLGDDGVAHFWQFNMSTQCPADGNGEKPNTYIPKWLDTVNAISGVKNFYTGINNTKDFSDINFKFIMYDVDRDYVTKNKGDCNNDGVDDMGYGPAGEPWWIDGINIYYAKIAEFFSNFLQVGGTTPAGGNASGVNGTQIEGPTGFGNSYSYTNASAIMMDFLFREHRVKRGPAFNHILFKQDTAAYDLGGGIATPLNSPMRMCMGMMMMSEGYMHHQGLNTASGDPDTWYDEDAVDATGKSVIKTDINGCIAAKGWLGNPKEDFRRIFDPALFDLGNDMLSSTGDFLSISNTQLWTENNITTDRQISELHCSKMAAYSYNRYGAWLKSPTFNVDVTKEYTVTFKARASVERRATFRVGSHQPTSILVDTASRRYVMTFGPTTGTTEFRVDLGRDNTDFWIEDVKVFEGSADLFMREFDNGIVVLNLGKSAQTVDLGTGAYKRILGVNGTAGAPQDAINDGSNVSSTGFSVPARDAVILVRQ